MPDEQRIPPEDSINRVGQLYGLGLISRETAQAMLKLPPYEPEPNA